MRVSPPKRVILTVIKVVSAILLLIALSPLIVASVIIIAVAARYRATVLPEVTVDSVPADRGPEVKTMSDAMSLLGDIPFGRSLPKVIATAVLAVLDIVPMALNTNRATAGMVYPYPEVFEPVVLQSKDGTHISGLLALQPGNGLSPAVVLVHGLFGCKNTYGILSLALRAYYRWGFHVLALDLRNFGDSSRFSEAPTSWGDRESDDIIAAAEYLESLEQVSTVGVYGVSMGAAAAILAGAKSRTEGPISGGVVAVNGYSDAARVIDHISTSRNSPGELIRWLFFWMMLSVKTLLGGPRPFGDYREYVQQVVSQYYEMSEEELYRKASPVHVVNEIEVPCLVIHSLNDYIVPVREAHELATAARNDPMVDFSIVPGGGHALYMISNRQWFHETLETFFSYWGEFIPALEGLSGATDMKMHENPDN